MTKEQEEKESLLDFRGTDKALDLLADLKKTSAGSVIYQHVERVLREANYAQNKILRGYAAVTQVLLNSYRMRLPKTSLLYMELRLVQKRLNPPIALSELAALHSYIRQATEIINKVIEPDNELFKDALTPLLHSIAEEETKQEAANVTAKPEVTVSAETQSDKGKNTYSTSSTASGTFFVPNADASLETIYQKNLSEQHQEILKMQISLTEKVGKTMLQHEAFTNKLGAILGDINNPHGELDLDEKKALLSQEIETICEAQSELKKILHETQSSLHLIGANSLSLSDELDKVRVLSLTDELTNLPNRRAFMRRLNDEMGRSQRDKTPLTLAMIDLDHFKAVNDKYGHSVGDEILKTYASYILSVFRRYDLVARYGGEEFAVLLPNTDKKGALRAFEKVKQKSAETYYQHEGVKIPVPTFSAGLAIYSPGESEEKIIERADNKLYKAKERGRNRVEFDDSYLGTFPLSGNNKL
jgi:diguanylate cyclase (GGDEF)-like protein